MSRARGRRIAAILAASVGLVVAGWWAWPPIGEEIRLRLAERAIGGRRLAEAEARLELLISERPRETRPRLLQVQVFRQQGRITEAEEALQRAVELGLPLEEGRREFALLMAGQDFARAEKSLRRIIEEEPGDLEVRRALEDGYSRARSRAGARWPAPGR